MAHFQLSQNAESHLLGQNWEMQAKFSIITLSSKPQAGHSPGDWAAFCDISPMPMAWGTKITATSILTTQPGLLLLLRKPTPSLPHLGVDPDLRVHPPGVSIALRTRNRNREAGEYTHAHCQLRKPAQASYREVGEGSKEEEEGSEQWHVWLYGARKPHPICFRNHRAQHAVGWLRTFSKSN